MIYHRSRVRYLRLHLEAHTHLGIPIYSPLYKTYRRRCLSEGNFVSASETSDSSRDTWPSQGDIEGRLFFHFNFIWRTTVSARTIYLTLDGTRPLESTQVLWVESGVQSQPARTGECLVKHPWPLGHQSAEVAPGWYETSPPAPVAGSYQLENNNDLLISREMTTLHS